jgi:hypothetical protein
MTPTNILGLNIPEGQKLFFWSSGGDGGTLLLAIDEEDAFRKVIQARIAAGCTREDALRWFRKNDHLEIVLWDYTG